MDSAIVGVIIVGIVIVLAVSFSGAITPGGSGFSLFSGNEPLASGSGSSEIKNPQPARGENESSFFNLVPTTPRVAGAETTGAGTAPPSSSSNSTQSQNKTGTKPGYSPLEKVVRIVRVERSSADPSNEYVTLKNGSSFFGSQAAGPVSVTGWSIETRNGARVSIPMALNIPLIDADPSPIKLPAGGQVIIATGVKGVGQNFRENACIGYFNELYTFTPQLSNDCVDDNPSVSTLLNNKTLSSSCIDFIRAIPSCRMPKYTSQDEAALGGTCTTFVNNNYSYTGCVKNFRDKTDFLKNTWRVFLGLGQKLFDPTHDRITLRDAKGLIVDVFEY